MKRFDSQVAIRLLTEGGLYLAMFLMLGWYMAPQVHGTRLPGDDRLYPKEEPAPVEPPNLVLMAVLVGTCAPIAIGSGLWYLRLRREDEEALALARELRAIEREEEATLRADPESWVQFDSPGLVSSFDPLQPGSERVEPTRSFVVAHPTPTDS